MISIPRYWPVTQHTDRITNGSTFVVINGKRNGLDFVNEALSRGAKKIVVDQDVPLLIQDVIKRHNATLIKVDDARKALADLSAQAWGNPQKKINIIGITGTKGKTTTTYLTRHILKHFGYKTAMLSGVKNYILDTEFDSELTTPHADYFYAFLKTCVKNSVEYLVMEVAAQGLSLHRVANTNFKVAVFTNLSQEHTEFYDTQEKYFEAKRKIFDQVEKNGINIVNIDDSWGKIISSELKECATVGCDESAKYKIHDLNTDFSGLSFYLNDIKVETKNFIGKFNAYNISDAFAICKELKFATPGILDAIKSFESVPGRMEKYRMYNGALAIVDYAHTPSSYNEVLSTLKNLTKDLIVVFGCGGDRGADKRPIMGKIAAMYADKIILTTDNPRSEDPEKIIADIMANTTESEKEKFIIELDRKKAINSAYTLSLEGSIIVVLGKGPDEYQIIKGTKTYFSDKECIKELQI